MTSDASQTHTLSAPSQLSETSDGFDNSSLVATPAGGGSEQVGAGRMDHPLNSVSSCLIAASQLPPLPPFFVGFSKLTDACQNEIGSH